MGKFFLYFGASSAATLMHYIVFYLLLGLLSAVSASVVASIAGALQAFVLNRKYVFKSQFNKSLSLRRFMLVASLSCLINFLLMWVLIMGLSAGPWLSQVIASLATFVLGYFLNSQWSYGQLPEEGVYE